MASDVPGGARRPGIGRLLRRPGLFGAGLLVFLPFAIMAAVPGWLAPFNPDEPVAAPLLNPSGAHLLGTDEIGRDVLSRVIFSARNDVTISLAATVTAFVGGTLLGLAVGYIGRWLDGAAMRIVDVMLSFPTIVLALFMVAVFGRGKGVEVLAIAIVMAPSMARIARGTSLSLRSRKYVEASVVSGASSLHVLRYQILPNALPTLLVAASVLASSSVLISASLGYLGVGIQAPESSWGILLRNAFDNVYNAPYYGIAPGVCITLLAGSYIMIGEGLRHRVLRGPGLVAPIDLQDASSQ